MNLVKAWSSVTSAKLSRPCPQGHHFAFEDQARYHGVDAEGKHIVTRVETSPGRMLLSEILPAQSNIPFALINAC